MRRDKKAFLNKQWKKKIGENYRKGKTRNLFNKIGDTKGEIHASIGTIKDKNGKDLTEEEKIKNRYMEELYKKVLMTQVTTIVWPFT